MPLLRWGHGQKEKNDMKTWTKYPPIKFSPVPNTENIEVIEEYVFEWEGVTYRIPKGFISDGASIPRILWAVITSPFFPWIITAAVMHDFIYRTRHIFITRESGDRLMKDVMADHGKSKTLKRPAIANALKLFGAKHYVPRIEPEVQESLEGIMDGDEGAA